eukprot:6202591-Pleurochrysis_carterae.AAC.1
MSESICGRVLAIMRMTRLRVASSQATASSVRASMAEVRASGDGAPSQPASDGGRKGKRRRHSC